MNDINNFFDLNYEIESSIRFIDEGIQQYSLHANDYNSYDLFLQYLSSGFERFMKSILRIAHYHSNGKFPSANFSKKYSHNLDRLLKDILDICFTDSYINKSIDAQNDYKYLSSDVELKKFIEILRYYGLSGRYSYI